MLKDKVKKDFFKAMKEKDTTTKGVLALLKARLESVEKENKGVITEEQEVLAVQSELKQTRASLLEAEKVDRQDVVELEKEKIAILESYLPEMLSEDEVLAILTESGASKGDNVGKLIGLVMKDHKGKVDGSLVRKVVMENFK